MLQRHENRRVWSWHRKTREGHRDVAFEVTVTVSHENMGVEDIPKGETSEAGISKTRHRDGKQAWMAQGAGMPRGRQGLRLWWGLGPSPRCRGKPLEGVSHPRAMV